MSKKASPTLVGLFTLGGIALIVAGIVAFGSGRFFSEPLRFVLHFDGSVKGLALGADVKFRGVRIGSVTDVGVVFNPQDFSFSIPVQIEVDLDRFRAANGDVGGAKLASLKGRAKLFEVLIERGLRAELKLDSLLTGQLFIEIDFHTDAPPIYRDPTGALRELPTIPSKLEQLTKTIETIPFEQVVHKVTSSLDAIERLLNAPELAGSVRALEQTLQEVRKIASGLEGELKQVAGSLDQTLGETRGLVKDARDRLGSLSEDVGGTANALRETGKRLDTVLVNLAAMTEGGGGLREEAGRALRELVDAARSLRLLAETIEARPDVLLRGKGSGTGGE